MSERTATHRVIFDFKAARRGARTLPEGLTWVNAPGIPAPLGDFPHAEYGGTCQAALLILSGHRVVADPWCTRELDHADQHVAHIRPGVPVFAWTDALNIRRAEAHA
jgi:hypothetical protein